MAVSTGLLLVLLPTRLWSLGLFGRNPYSDYDDIPPIVELVDRITVPLSLVVGCFAGLFSFVVGKRAAALSQGLEFTSSAMAFGFLSLSIAVVNEFPVVSVTQTWSSMYFSGFGPQTLLMVWTILAGLLMWFSVPLSQEHRFELRRLQTASRIWTTSFILVFYVPALVVTARAVPFRYDWAIVLSEVLGPRVGRSPLLDWTPQYSSLLGWPLIGLRGISESLILEISVLYLSFLFLMVIATLYWTTKLFLPRGASQISLVICLGTCLYRPDSSIVGSLTSLPSFAVRHILPAAGMSLLISGIVKHSAWQAMLSGLILGASYVNNFEFGTLTLVSVLLTAIPIGLRYSSTRKFLLVASSATTLSILGFFLISGREAWNRHSIIARTYNNGWGNLAMPIFGLHYLTLALSVTAITIGLWDIARTRETIPKPGSIIAFTFGLYALFGHFYFSGRSVVSTQLQSTLPFVGLATAAAITPIATQVIRTVKNGNHNSLLVLALPMLLVAILPVSVLLGLPNPSLEWARLSGDIAEPEIPGNNRLDSKVFQDDELFQEVKKVIELAGNDTTEVGVVAPEYSFVYELLTGARGFVPTAIWGYDNSVFQEEFCESILGFSGRFVVVGVTQYPSIDIKKNQVIKDSVRDCLRDGGRRWSEEPSNSESPLTIVLPER